MRSLYEVFESILDSDKTTKSKVADEVELFNATVRSTFRGVFKNYLDFSTEDYSHSYITYKFKKNMTRRGFNDLTEMFIDELKLLYRTEIWDTLNNNIQCEIDIVFKIKHQEIYNTFSSIDELM